MLLDVAKKRPPGLHGSAPGITFAAATGPTTPGAPDTMTRKAQQEDSRTGNRPAWDGYLGDPMEPCPISDLRLMQITKPTSAYTAVLSCRLTLDQAVRAREILTYIRGLLADVHHGRELHHPTDAYETCAELLNTAIYELDGTCRSIEDTMTDDHHAEIYLV